MVKEHTGTPRAFPHFVVHWELIIEAHLIHSFIVDVQPSFPATIPVRVEHVDCIVSAACGLAMVVEHAD